MAKPSDKSPGMEQFLEGMFGRTTAIEADKCVRCKKDAKEFKDALSKKEYSISGLCQKCQDGIYGKYDE